MSIKASEMKKVLVKKQEELKVLEDDFSKVSQDIATIEDLMSKYKTIEDYGCYLSAKDKLSLLETKQAQLQDYIEDCEFAIGVLEQDIKKEEGKALVW